ncbi:MAG: 2-C-methyl-D-erythritol 4-phosphate cytidylyltransferase [Crocinitomicaceae bacterium]
MSFSSIKHSVIITAGGTGKRMGGAIPKQFLEIDGKPIIMHTIEKFVDFDSDIQVVVVIPSDQKANWNKLCQKHNFSIKHEIVEGGVERFFSVKNGLAIASGELIAVHDAVRPFVSKKVIENCFSSAQQNGAAVPVISLKESIRTINGQTTRAVSRKDFALVQTPQCFQSKLLKAAYQSRYKNEFMDDASVVEYAGGEITAVAGNEENIKITSPMDLKWAKCIMDHE